MRNEGVMKLSHKRKNSAEDELSTLGKQACMEASMRLTDAVEKGSIEAVAELLNNEGQKGCSLSNYSKQRALEIALRHEGKNNIQMLQSHPDKSESVVLQDDRHEDYFTIIKALIKAGAPIHEKTAEGNPILNLAVQFRCSTVVISYLLNECLVDSNLLDNSGKTALMQSILLRDYETAQVLIHADKCKFAIKDNFGETVFDLAKKNGSIDLLRIFKNSHESGMPPMILAVYEQNNDLAGQLININSKFAHQRTKDNHTPLTVALGGLNKGDLIKLNPDLITTLIKAGSDVNSAHPYSNYTPLMLMAGTNAVDLTKLLLNYGATVDMIGPHCRTAVMIAARKRDCGNLEVLLNAGANPCTRDKKGKNALDHALAGGCLTCVFTLLIRYSHLQPHRLREIIGEKPLQFLLAVKEKWLHNIHRVQVFALFTIAIKLGFQPIVLFMLENYPFNLNGFLGPDNPLHLALKNVRLVQLLISYGANVDKVVLGQTALLKAAKEGYMDVMKVLIQHNANMYAEDIDGYTTLCIACKLNNFEMVQILLHRGMNLNHIPSNGQSALQCAVSERNLILTQTLIELGADVNVAYSGNVTVLMKAIQNHHNVGFIEMLVDSGADIHAQDSHSETPLMYALEKRNCEKVASLLLKKGANVNHISSVHGRTPLMLAAKFPSHKILQILMVYGAADTVNAQSIDGNTALHVAASCALNDSNMLKVLVDNGANMNLFNSEDETPLMIAMKELKVKCVRFLVETGADVLFQNSEENRQKWIKHLNKMLKKCRYLNMCSNLFWKYVKCIEAVLDRGCPLVEMQSSNLRRFFSKCIAINAQRVVVLLLRAGLSPYVLSVAAEKAVIPKSVPTHFTTHYCNSTMCIAVRCCRKEIVTIFGNYCFYHEEDMHMMQHHTIKSLVNCHFFRKEKSTTPPLSVTPKTWSLATWSTIAINKVIGFGETRESSINQLPLPQAMKNKLLCRDIKLPERFSSKHFRYGPNVPPVRFEHANLGALHDIMHLLDL